MHDLDGVDLNASFVVCSVIPDARTEGDAVGAVLAELAGLGGVPVTVHDAVWVRSESVVAVDGGEGRPGVRARKVDYVTAVPGDERRWVVVTCTVLADGDPDGLPSGLVVQLFDAIMSTWRWSGRADKAA